MAWLFPAIPVQIQTIKDPQFHLLAKSSDQYVRGIQADIAEATNIKVADQQAKNSERGLVGSVLNGLISVLKANLIPETTPISNLGQYLSDATGTTVEGFAKGGLIGLLGGLVKAIIIEFRTNASKIGENALKGKGNRYDW